MVYSFSASLTRIEALDTPLLKFIALKLTPAIPDTWKTAVYMKALVNGAPLYTFLPRKPGPFTDAVEAREKKEAAAGPGASWKTRVAKETMALGGIGWLWFTYGHFVEDYAMSRLV